MQSRDAIFALLRDALVELFELEPEQISLESNLYQDLEIDSIDAIDLIAHLKQQTGKKIAAEDFKAVRTVAWCSGGAQGMMETAIDSGVDVYITGEASEQNFHMAHETGTAFIAAGHHATERYGIQALGQAVAEQFGIRVEFLDLDNPV